MPMVLDARLRKPAGILVRGATVATDDCSYGVEFGLDGEVAMKFKAGRTEILRFNGTWDFC